MCPGQIPPPRQPRLTRPPRSGDRRRVSEQPDARGGLSRRPPTAPGSVRRRARCEQLGACRGLPVGRGCVAGETQRSNKERLVVLVERVDADQLGCVIGGAVRLVPGDTGKCGLVQQRLDGCRQVPPLAVQPQLEARAFRERHATEQVLAELGKLDDFDPAAAGEDVDVDERGRGQHQPQRVARHDGPPAENPAQLCQAPPQRGERVMGVRKEQAGQLLTRRRDRHPDEIGEQPPCLVASRLLHLAVPRDVRCAEQRYPQAHVASRSGFTTLASLSHALRHGHRRQESRFCRESCRHRRP